MLSMVGVGRYVFYVNITKYSIVNAKGCIAMPVHHSCISLSIPCSKLKLHMGAFCANDPNYGTTGGSCLTLLLGPGKN